jgi:uncharacterized protein YjlB
MKSIKIVPFFFNHDGIIPNSKLPVLIYKNVLSDAIQEDLEQTFKQNGWTNNWKDIILPYDHFHSTTHEVLGLLKGKARLMIGGKDGQEIIVETGDVIVIPAGVGHYSLDNSIDYQFVGGYPNGAAWDLKISLAENAATIMEEIAKIPLPNTDPIFGENGPLVDYWKK